MHVCCGEINILITVNAAYLRVTDWYRLELERLSVKVYPGMFSVRWSCLKSALLQKQTVLPGSKKAVTICCSFWFFLEHGFWPKSASSLQTCHCIISLSTSSKPLVTNFSWSFFLAMDKAVVFLSEHISHFNLCVLNQGTQRTHISFKKNPSFLCGFPEELAAGIKLVWTTAKQI